MGLLLFYGTAVCQVSQSKFSFCVLKWLNMGFSWTLNIIYMQHLKKKENYIWNTFLFWPLVCLTILSYCKKARKLKIHRRFINLLINSNSYLNIQLSVPDSLSSQSLVLFSAWLYIDLVDLALDQCANYSGSI